jgi:formimidoylglutamate deiminase
MVLFADRALLPDGLASNVRIEIDADGAIGSVGAGAAPGDAEILRGTLLPGMTNAHSHAFQRAMAGRAERGSPYGNDNFWSWREAMYALANRLTPDQLFAIARSTYAEMLAAGYTCVVEFHYLHRDPAARWYAERAAMAMALIAAAKETGIAITLLPALYAHGDVGGAPLHDRQRRFATRVDDVLAIAGDLRVAYAGDPDVTIGACAHSLRAVTPQELAALVAGSPKDVPIHLHIAEQEREVDAVRTVLGARPVAWLLANADVGARWTLVHATHMIAEETVAVARSGATVALAPTTEANLGDGIFPLRPYLDDGGAFGIGSDSNISIDVGEELRWLEYAQRLVLRRRNVAASLPGESSGEALYRRAAHGGAHAAGRQSGAIDAGSRADLVFLEGTPENEDDVLDRFIFASQPKRPTRTMVSGKWMTV